MTVTLSAPGTLGTNAGANSDGVVVGALTATALDTFLLESHALASLVVTSDGGAMVNETTPANEATGDDVEIVGATIATNDAIYIGHATKQFAEFIASITTQGDYTTTTFATEYFNGTAWGAVSDLVDGTSAWEAATGEASVAFTLPEDWEKTNVNHETGQLNGYWVRMRCTATGGTTTPCQIGQIWVVAEHGNGTFTDDTTDANDAGAGDVALLPASIPVVNDAAYAGLDEKFCKVQVVTSQAATGTHTILPEYWNGSAWGALTTVEDASSGYSESAGAHFVSFVPPADWVACTAENGPDGETGYFVRLRLSAKTTVTQQPLATRLYVYPLVTGASGHKVPAMTSVTASADCMTVSGTDADSVMLFVNVATGVTGVLTWTGGDKVDSGSLGSAFATADGDEVAVVQITEDASTEFAGATFYLHA